MSPQTWVCDQCGAVNSASVMSCYKCGAKCVAEIVTADLAHHEAVIERGLNTFVEVGNALLAIRDERLYRADYATFEDYCRERWGLSRPRAYELISAANVVSAMADTGLPAPGNERQVRELARVPEPERAEVWRETVERTGGRPTAAAIRQTHQPTPPPTPPEPEPGIWYGGPAADEQPEPELPAEQDRAEETVAALDSVHAALDEHAPDPGGEIRAWRRSFLAALSAARKPLQFRASVVAEHADDECLDELARFVADLTRYSSDVEAAGRDADVIQIGGRR